MRQSVRHFPAWRRPKRTWSACSRFHGALPRARLEEYYASYVAGMFRTVRFGIAKAHGQAEMMEFNYLAEKRAITRDASGRYAVDYAHIPGAVSDLAKEFLEIEATGNRQRAESWFSRYDRMPPAPSKIKC